MSVKIVKSAARIFEILELYDRERRPMTAVEIANSLNYPLASTHELLKTLHHFGYFSYGHPKWTYAPAPKISSVVDWVRDAITDDQRIYSVMDDLNTATRETINLSRQMPTGVRIINGLECLHRIGVSSKPGTVMSVISSLTGLTSIAALPETDRLHYLSRLEKLDPQQYGRLDGALLESLIEELETYGTTMRSDVAVDGIGAVCIPIRPNKALDVLILGVVGPGDRIEANAAEHQKAIRKALSAHKLSPIYRIRNR